MFIKTHQKLTKFVEKLSKLFRPILFTQYLMSSLLLCVLGFQLVKSPSLVKKLIAFMTGCATLNQTYIYSFGGQLVRDKSSTVAENFYEIDKDFVLVIARTQKPSTFSAWFYEANLMTFQLILKRTVSLITVLKSMID